MTTGGWGSTGGVTYAVEGNTANYAVNNGTATIKLPSASSNRAALLPIAAGNASMVFSVSFDRLPVSGNEFAYAVARNVSTGVEYRAKLKVDSSGNVLVGLSAVNGPETTLVSDATVTRIGTYVPGRVIRLRTYVTGYSPTHLGVRAWLEGTTEPDGWDLRAEDWTSALQVPGSWGVRAFLSSGAQAFPTVAFQSLLIKTRNPDAGVSTWYVSSIGSDDSAGTSVAPFRSIQAAVNASIPGDTVVVGSGSYSPFVVRVSGRASAPFMIHASAGDHPVVFGGTSTTTATIKLTGAAAYVTIDGLTVQGTTGTFNSGVLVESITAAPITLRDLTVTQNDGYGIRLFNSDNVLVEDSDISHSGTGIQVFGHGSNVVIRNNDVHDNDRMITNTQGTPNDDTGAIGIDLNQSIGAVLVTGNDLWGNRAHSFDYVWDGGAFDIYSASNATISRNRSWDNENVLETGRGSTSCSNNVFTYNEAWAATTQGRSWGIFLRCGDNMLIAHNSLIGIERFVISLSDDNSSFAGSIAGARIVDNILTATGTGKVFGLPTAGTLPASVSIDHDLVRSPNGVIATIAGAASPATTLAELRSSTGYEVNGLSADPLVVDATNGDLRLTSGSPAIDAGIVLPSDTAPFNGAGPDLGALESGP